MNKEQLDALRGSLRKHAAVLIVAENYREFTRYRDVLDLGSTECIFASSDNTLMSGLPAILLCGRFTKSNNWRYFSEVINIGHSLGRFEVYQMEAIL